MDIADNVEGAGFRSFVVVQRVADDLRDRIYLFGGLELIDMPEPFVFEGAKATPELTDLLGDDVFAKIPIHPFRVPLFTHLVGGIDDDGYGQDVVFAGEPDPVFSGRFLDIGGIDHREESVLESFGGDEAGQLEGIGRGGEAVLVVADDAAAKVG